MPEELEMSPSEDSENNQKKKRRAILIVLIVLAILCLVLVLLLILTFVLCIHCRNCDSDQEQPTPASEGFTVEDSLMHFIHVSDVSLDLKYNGSIPRRDFCRPADGSSTTAEFKAPFGRIGCDTPLMLLDSSLKAMKNATDGKNLAFVLISGKLKFICFFIIKNMEKYIALKNFHTGNWSHRLSKAKVKKTKISRCLCLKKETIIYEF